MQPKPLTLEEPSQLAITEDLCSACISRQDCCLRSNTAGPTHQCNEYDDGTPAQNRPPNRLYSVPLARENPAAAMTQTHQGLCMNCDLRDECTLPRATGGVWHCEEYR